jgi:hypothetical protein
MGGSGGLTTIQTLMRNLVQAANGVAAAISGLSPFATSQAANSFLAAPSTGAGLPTFRRITAADLPTPATPPTPPAPVSGSVWTGATTDTSLTATTGALTAPVAGLAVILLSGTSGLNGTTWTAMAVSIAASNGTPTLVGEDSAAPQISGVGYMPMAAGQSSTFTATAAFAAGTYATLTITVFFVPSGG